MIEITKNSREKLRLELCKYRDRDVINFRVWADTENGPVATRKGIAFSVDNYLKFREALDKFETELIESGVIKKSYLKTTEGKQG